MVAADTETVAVAHDDDDGKLGTREANARGDRQSPPMDAVKTVSLEIVGEAARASDAGNRDNVLRIEVVFAQHALERS
jgi:hypothetical protein